jgi:hypothetical protein
MSAGIFSESSTVVAPLVRSLIATPVSDPCAQMRTVLECNGEQIISRKQYFAKILTRHQLTMKVLGNISKSSALSIAGHRAMVIVQLTKKVCESPNQKKTARIERKNDWKHILSRS